MSRILSVTPAFSALLALLWLPLLASGSNSSNCDIGHFCYSDAIGADDMIPCMPSQYCPGDQAAQLCAKGYYCPDPTQQIECPSGHYCPPASIMPRPCSPLAWCPSGSYRYLHVGCLVLLILLLPFIFSARHLYDALNRRLRAAKLAATDATIEMADLGGAQRKGSAAGDAPQGCSKGTVPRMEVKFDNLQAAVDVSGVEKVILSDVSGHFRASRLIAVMGPSGAGKSSFISVLTGGVRLKSGSIESRIEGGLESDLRKARTLGMIGVVPQADIMIPQLTPRDILTHSAFTRLPATWTNQAKYERIDETLRVLNLTRVQHTPVGDEDGGEKKRVSIGIELVNSPSLLILDEPTTGLDATSSASLLATLKDITRLNTTVVAVLHQPRNEIFRGLDDLLLLAPGGRTVYFGPAARTQAYFETIGYTCDGNTNPSDFFIDVIAGKAGSPFAMPRKGSHAEPDEQKTNKTLELAKAQACATIATAEEIQAYLVDAWKQEKGESFRSELASADGALLASRAIPNSDKAFKSDIVLPSLGRLTWLYLYRGLLQMWRSLATIQLELLMHILAGCVIGMAFVEDNWFIGPINPSYVKYCPEPMQRSCAQDAVRDVLNLMTTYTVMALGLVAAIIGNRCYGGELLNMSREASAGLSPFAYWLGKALSELPLIVLYSFVYVVSYYVVSSPGSSFNDFYAAILCFEFVCFGIGYVSSLLLGGENALLLAAISALLGGLATENSTVKSICWARWLSEAIFISEARIDLLKPPVDTITQLYMDGRNNFKIDNWKLDIGVLVIMGCVLRLMTLGLVFKKFRR